MKELLSDFKKRSMSFFLARRNHNANKDLFIARIVQIVLIGIVAVGIGELTLVPLFDLDLSVFSLDKELFGARGTGRPVFLFSLVEIGNPALGDALFRGLDFLQAGGALQGVPPSMDFGRGDE